MSSEHIMSFPYTSRSNCSLNNNSNNVVLSLDSRARYVWENLDVGYIQGMCDLVAPLLVIFDDGEFTSACCHEVACRIFS